MSRQFRLYVRSSSTAFFTYDYYHWMPLGDDLCYVFSHPAEADRVLSYFVRNPRIAAHDENDSDTGYALRRKLGERACLRHPKVLSAHEPRPGDVCAFLYRGWHVNPAYGDFAHTAIPTFTAHGDVLPAHSPLSWHEHYRYSRIDNATVLSDAFFQITTLSVMG